MHTQPAVESVFNGSPRGCESCARVPGESVAPAVAGFERWKGCPAEGGASGAVLEQLDQDLAPLEIGEVRGRKLLAEFVGQ